LLLVQAGGGSSRRIKARARARTQTQSSAWPIALPWQLRFNRSDPATVVRLFHIGQGIHAAGKTGNDAFFVQKRETFCLSLSIQLSQLLLIYTIEGYVEVFSLSPCPLALDPTPL
jgi:hypothetical protein